MARKEDRRALEGSDEGDAFGEVVLAFDVGGSFVKAGLVAVGYVGYQKFMAPKVQGAGDGVATERGYEILQTSNPAWLHASRRMVGSMKPSGTWVV